MASGDISDSGRITWVMTETSTNELMQWSVACWQRAGANIGTLLAAAETWWTTDVTGTIGGMTLTSVRYSSWQEGTDFTGYHVLQTLLTNDVKSSAGILPPQCAIATSLLNTSEGGTGIRSRRGRYYLGPVLKTAIGTDGRLNVPDRDAVKNWAVALHGRIQTVPPTTGGAALPGLCIASRTLGIIMEVNKVGCGQGVDTQRRRREKVVEAVSYTTL